MVPGRDGWVKNIIVMPGRNGNNLPYGVVTSDNFRSVIGWTNDGDQNYDYGAIILSTDLGNSLAGLVLVYFQTLTCYHLPEISLVILVISLLEHNGMTITKLQTLIVGKFTMILTLVADTVAVQYIELSMEIAMVSPFMLMVVKQTLALEL